MKVSSSAIDLSGRQDDDDSELRSSLSERCAVTKVRAALGMRGALRSSCAGSFGAGASSASPRPASRSEYAEKAAKPGKVDCADDGIKLAHQS